MNAEEIISKHDIDTLCDDTYDNLDSLPVSIRKFMCQLLSEHDSRLEIPWCDLAEKLSELVETAADEWTGVSWNHTSEPGQVSVQDRYSADMSAAIKYIENNRDANDEDREEIYDEKVNDCVEEIYLTARALFRENDSWSDCLDEAIDSAESAVTFAESVETSANNAAEHGRDAVRMLTLGRYSDALDCLEAASSAETDYGGDPSWGVPLKWLRELEQPLEEMDLSAIARLLE